MKFTRPLIASVIACAALAGVALTAGYAGATFRRASAPPSAPVIAVIDLESAFNQLAERTDLEAQLKSQRDALQKRLEDLQDEAKGKATEAEQLSGPAKTAKLREARDAVIRAEFEGQFSQKKLDETRGELRRELYLKITEAVQTLSKQNGYALVLASDESAKIPLADPDTVARAISFKRMLHVDPALDITSDVVTMMNNAYNAGVRTPAPAKGGNK